MAKRRKYFINEEEVIPLLEAYGLNVRIMNFYQLRLKNPEYPQATWDWYHTQGSVVKTENGVPARVGTIGCAEDLAEKINKYVYNLI